MPRAKSRKIAAKLDIYSVYDNLYNRLVKTIRPAAEFGLKDFFEIGSTHWQRRGQAPERRSICIRAVCRSQSASTGPTGCPAKRSINLPNSVPYPILRVTCTAPHTRTYMISKLLYRCPLCGGFDWLQDARCIHCRVSVAMERPTRLTIAGRSAPIADWYDRILDMVLPVDRQGLIYKSGSVRLLKEVSCGRYVGPGGLTALLYGRRFLETVSAALYTDRIELAGPTGTRTLVFSALLSATIESNVIILVQRDSGTLFLDFENDSGKKWEDGIRRALADYRSPEKIVEYFPRILTVEKRRRLPAPGPARRMPRVPDGPPAPAQSHPLYALARLIVRTIVQKWLRVELSGREHLPGRGPAILLGNHSSFLDAILLEAATDRNIWFMAKNSEYKGRFMTWFLGLARSFPVRRYTVDVQAVRNAIRVVQSGHILGIFPEGERNWDNRLLPFKRGTMRLVLALGVPVIPVGISGAYGLMPRWTHRIRRAPVHVRFGAPVSIKPVPIAAQTEADIAAVTEELRGCIQALID